MRRMRGFAWYHLLFAVPAVAAALSVQYFMHKNYPEPVESDSASAMKPSAFKADSGAVTGQNGGDDQESADAARSRDKKHGKHASRGKTSSDMGDDATVGMTDEGAEAGALTGSGHARHGSRHVASDDGTLAAPTVAGSFCAPVEYRGDGPMATSFTANEWAMVLNQFHEAKGALGNWLSRHKNGFSDRTAELMRKQLEATRLQRPPSLEEPDLAWRGIGVWTLDVEGKPLIRIGGGFVKLVVKQPARARFELTRLVAQSWAPCELARGSAGESWEPLTRCMGVNETAACGNGSYSDAGWAVSSALAAIVAHPGCTVPAFAKADASQCLAKMPLPLLANSERMPASAKMAKSTTNSSTEKQ